MPALLQRRKTLIIIAAVAVIGLLAIAAFFVLQQNKVRDKSTDNSDSSSAEATNTNSKSNKTTADISWQWSGEKWVASDTPAACTEPFLTTLPVNLDLVTDILYPGQTRGGDFKAHGGFRFGKSKNTDITVTVPLEASVVNASRYIEGGEVQHLFTLINPCGLAYRFDHLHTLSEKFQQIANTLPEAKVDNSATTSVNPPVKFKKGETVATAVGFINNQNVSVDFGVYDLRVTNEASKKASFAQAYGNSKEYTFYGVCWLDTVPSEISTKLHSLPGSGSEGKISDYCK